MVDYGKYLIETPTKNELYGIFADKECFAALIDDLVSCITVEVDRIVALETYGLIIGAALAQRLAVGLVPIRASGRLVVPALQERCTDYSHREKILELPQGCLTKGERVLLVDDWIETGAQMRASIRLVERAGAQVVGIAVISAERKESTADLFEKNLISVRIEER